MAEERRAWRDEENVDDVAAQARQRVSHSAKTAIAGIGSLWESFLRTIPPVYLLHSRHTRRRPDLPVFSLCALYS